MELFSLKLNFISKTLNHIKKNLPKLKLKKEIIIIKKSNRRRKKKHFSISVSRNN